MSDFQRPAPTAPGGRSTVLGVVVGAILAFFAGLARVGPTTASILSTLEPVVTVALAALVFGESLGAVQLAGGALVLAAVVVLQAAPQRVPRVQARTSRSGLPVMRLGRRAPGAGRPSRARPRGR